MQKKITKVIIPVAGLGTRMLPATKAIPKEMLPLVDKPLIQYVVNECVAAGFQEIILVTHASKNSIENHFDTSFELESILEKRVKRQLLSEIKTICPNDVTIMHVRQGTAKGLGHAILCAHPLVGDNPVAVVLPDVIINQHRSDLRHDNLAAMVERFSSTGCNQIMVDQVPLAEVNNYGIVDCHNVELGTGQFAPIYGMVEKPSPEKSPSNLSIVGRYVLSEGIWPLLKKTPLGAGGEIQLTDAIAMLLDKEKIEAYHLVGSGHDCGNKLGYIKAFIEYSLKDKEYAKDLKQWLSQYLKESNDE